MNQNKKREKTSHPNIVRYLSSGIYYAKVSGHEISLKTTNFKDAKIALRYVLTKYDKLKNLNIRLKVRDLKAPYLDFRRSEVRRGEIREITYREAEWTFNKKIEPLFGHLAPHSIDSVVWDEIRTKKRIAGEKHVRKVLAHFLKWCVKNRYSQGVPILDVTKRSVRKRRILQPQEMKALYSNSYGSLHLFIAMALFMGMRRGEIIKLEWRDVDLRDNFLTILSQKAKTKRERSLPLAPEVLRLLIERRQQTKSSWVFPHAHDKKMHASIDGLRKSWARCKRAAGLENEDITWHDLRATCEYYAHMRRDLTPTQLEKFFGADVDVQRRIYVSMGHEDLRGIEKSVSLQQVTDGGSAEGDDQTKLVDKADK